MEFIYFCEAWHTLKLITLNREVAKGFQTLWSLSRKFYASLLLTVPFTWYDKYPTIGIVITCHHVMYQSQNLPVLRAQWSRPTSFLNPWCAFSTWSTPHHHLHIIWNSHSWKWRWSSSTFMVPQLVSLAMSSSNFSPRNATTSTCCKWLELMVLHFLWSPF